MTRCAETPMRVLTFAVPPSVSRWLLTAVAAMVVAGCQAPARKPDVPSAATPPPAVAPKPAVPAKGDPDERFKAALKLMKDRQSKEAREAFFNLAKDFPEFSGPFTDLAIVQAQAKQPQLAIANFEKATRLNPQNALAWNWLGTLYREGNDYPKAEAAYTSALTLKPDYAAAHLNLGILNDVYLRRPQTALTHYRDYQRISGGERLIVAAWIRELEAQVPPPAPAAPAAAPVAGAAPATAGAKP